MAEIEGINYSTIKKYIQHSKRLNNYLYDYEENHIKIDGEQWRKLDINGKFIEISNMGRVKFQNGRITTGSLCKENQKYYKSITFNKNNMYIHRMVLSAFLPIKDSSKYQVDHLNKDKTDNRLSNLEWVTPKINTTRAVGHEIYQLDENKNVIKKFSSKADAAYELAKNREYAHKLTLAIKNGTKKWGYYWTSA